ncbi:MAG TPA: universal stress protein [Ignavibacteriales bacterium]|nr:universal stress protein [Ignavibacteriales bacterium]HEX3074007.1 universal stress protein [Ignavibacteriales bacterium]
MFNVKKIIVPTDFSKLSFTAFDYARSLAAQYNAKIYLMFVMEKMPPFLAVRSLDVDEKQVLSHMEDEAKKELREAAELLRGDSDLQVESIFKKGVDYEEVVKFSEEAKADLIIIATHGRTGILHTLLGSVAEKVIRYSKCPVLVTTPSEEDL